MGNGNGECAKCDTVVVSCNRCTVHRAVAWLVRMAVLNLWWRGATARAHRLTHTNWPFTGLSSHHITPHYPQTSHRASHRLKCEFRFRRSKLVNSPKCHTGSLSLGYQSGPPPLFLRHPACPPPSLAAPPGWRHPPHLPSLDYRHPLAHS